MPTGEQPSRLACSLDETVACLAECRDPALAEEAEGLAQILRAFRSRVAVGLPGGDPSEGATDSASGMREDEETEEPEEKDWSAPELRKVGLRMPYCPEVYVQRKRDKRERKEFHTPLCPYARYAHGTDLTWVLEDGYKPCKTCGGVRTTTSLLEVAAHLDELHRLAEQVWHFAQGNFEGWIDLFDAHYLLGSLPDELEKMCRDYAKHCKRDEKEFTMMGEIRVRRMKKYPTDARYSFEFWRPDCVGYAWKRLIRR